MSLVALEVVEANDPLIQFTLKLDNAGVISAADLTGATVECYLKPRKDYPDTDSSVVKYDNASAGGITITSPATAGIVTLQLTAVALDQSKSYHLDVIKAGKRLTFAYGAVKVAGV